MKSVVRPSHLGRFEQDLGHITWAPRIYHEGFCSGAWVNVTLFLCECIHCVHVCVYQYQSDSGHPLGLIKLYHPFPECNWCPFVIPCPLNSYESLKSPLIGGLVHYNPDCVWSLTKGKRNLNYHFNYWHINIQSVSESEQLSERFF